MDRTKLSALLQSMMAGETSLDGALEALTRLPGADIGYAHLDLHRAERTGHPEVVYGEGKSGEQIAGILERLHLAGQEALATRVSAEKAEHVLTALPGVRSHPVARCLHLPAASPAPAPPVLGPVAVVCAGTSDLPVAEEAAVVAEVMGNPVLRIQDVGVAGLHRILGATSSLRRASVLIVVAGMEGALPGVVAGLVERPVIAVPTSVGYGASMGGIAALLTMLNSCSTGLSVVNIDNGFGAAMVASRMNRVPGGGVA